LIPAGFVISPLPNEISSFFVIRALRMTELSLSPNKKNPMGNGTAPGDAGSPSAPNPAYKLTLTSLNYLSQNKSSSSKPSLPFTESLSGINQDTFLASVRAPWFHPLSEMPQATWLQCFGLISNGAPFTSKGAPSYSPPSGPF
jgi:hypothetical protein